MKHIFEAQEALYHLEDKYYHKGIHQITIDLIEDTYMLMHKDESTELKTRDWPTVDELGSLSYRCGILLEVLNPEYTLDIQAVNELQQCIAETLRETVRVNQLLRARDLLQSGHAGVDPQGNIVDVREHPKAVPVPPHSNPAP